MPGVISLLSECSAKLGNGVRVFALRAGRKLSAARNLPVAPGFFDQYPRYFETSETTPFANRLNQRYRACIDWKRPVIQGQRVLDIASHDGRWSFAALKAGAAHVVGIEARDHLVQASSANLRAYAVCFANVTNAGWDAVDAAASGEKITRRDREAVATV